MSKYTPLQRDLSVRPRSEKELPLSFGEIETILGFKLPPSARLHSAAWWSNEHGTHVQARAWIDAGWKVLRVDRKAERVYFRPRDHDERRSLPRTKRTTVEIDLESLPTRAARLVSDYASENGGDLSAAISQAIEEAAAARRSRLIDRIRANAPVVPDNSTDLIREDRDGR